MPSNLVGGHFSAGQFSGHPSKIFNTKKYKRYSLEDSSANCLFFFYLNESIELAEPLGLDT